MPRKMTEAEKQAFRAQEVLFAAAFNRLYTALGVDPNKLKVDDYDTMVIVTNNLGRLCDQLDTRVFYNVISAVAADDAIENAEANIAAIINEHDVAAEVCNYIAKETRRAVLAGLRLEDMPNSGAYNPATDDPTDDATRSDFADTVGLRKGKAVRS